MQVPKDLLCQSKVYICELPGNAAKSQLQVSDDFFNGDLPKVNLAL